MATTSEECNLESCKPLNFEISDYLKKKTIFNELFVGKLYSFLGGYEASFYERTLDALNFFVFVLINFLHFHISESIQIQAAGFCATLKLNDTRHQKAPGVSAW
jgi:hypothetical protein